MATSKKPKTSRAPKVLTRDEMQFCEHFCIHGSQTQAYRQTWPSAARPADHATKLMKRADVREHIGRIHEHMKKKAAERSAEALTLTLEKAESRLAEMIDVRRLNRGEMFTQMTGQIQDEGLSFELVEGPRGGKKMVPKYSVELIDSYKQPKPIDDADLVKAIDTTFKRMGAYPGKKDAAPAPTVNHYLYQPKWLVQQAQPQLAAGDE